MKKVNILKSNLDFNRIIKDNKAYRFYNFYVYIEKNNSTTYKFGISVSKKLGKAILRNKYKRRIKSILDKKEYKTGFNCIIILKKSVLNLSYTEMEKEILDILDKMKLVKE